MATIETPHGVMLGTLSGTALTVAGNVGSSDLLKTALLAALGASVSYIASAILKWLTKKLGK